MKHTRKNEDNRDTKRRRHYPNECENEDNKNTLSDFPDSILHHILSFLKAKEAVRTCILSSRWQHLWKHLPALTLYSSDFKTVEDFMKFVTRILSLRDSSAELKALDFERRGRVEPHVLKSIVRYAASHNVNRLRLSFGHISFGDPRGIRHFMSSLLSCHSLTSLDIGFQNYPLKFLNSLNLPALTYLKLHYLSFYCGKSGRVEPFSTFKRLNTLILYNCIVWDVKPLCISSTTLLNLSIHTDYVYGCRSNIDLFAPSLCTFAFTCNSFQKLSGSHLSSIKQVRLDINKAIDPVETTLGMLNWLIKITNIKSLTVTPSTLQALSLVPDILKLKLTCLCNLKSLKINLESCRFPAMTRRDIKLELASGKSWKENVKLQETIKAGLEPIYSSILDGMIEFLLQNSPSAKVDILLGS